MRVGYRPVGSRVLDGFIEYIRVLRDLAEPPKAGTEAENAGDIKELRPGCSEPADFTALPWLKGAQPCWPRKPCPCQRGPRSQQLGQHQEWRSCTQFSLLFLHLWTQLGLQRGLHVRLAHSGVSQLFNPHRPPVQGRACSLLRWSCQVSGTQGSPPRRAVPGCLHPNRVSPERPS